MLVSDLQELPHPLRFESRKGAKASGTKNLVNDREHPVWFAPTGMNGPTTSKRNPIFFFGWKCRKVTSPFTIHPEFPKF